MVVIIFIRSYQKKVDIYFRSDPEPFFHETDTRNRSRIKMKRFRNTASIKLFFLHSLTKSLVE